MSSRIAKPIVGVVIALAGLCATLVWPAWSGIGIGIAFLGAGIVFGGVVTFHVPATGALMRVGFLVYTLAVYFGTRSPWLAASTLSIIVGLVGWSPSIVRRFGYETLWVLPIAWAVAVVSLALSWPFGLQTLAVVPALLFLGLNTFMGLNAWKGFKANTPGKWAIKIGEPVQDFTLSARDGSTFTLSDARGQYVLLALLRGDWCPVCHVKMRLYQREAARLSEHNVKIVAVSPTAGADAKTFAKDLGAEYTLLEDPNNEVARIFGAVFPKAGPKGADGPLPASFLIDPEGKLHQSTDANAPGSFLDPGRLIEMLNTRRTTAAA